jgi:hypothetical protein
MKFSNKIRPFLILLTALLFFACAKQVAITGGPKDTAPPVLEKTTPPNGSVNFIDKKIIIEFDEYVKLNSLNQKLIVSPPIEEAPVIVLKGKGIKISLNPALLQPNTTYSFNFNDAIADNNENNSLNSFVYAFSTGAVIDSLSFSGIVLDAFTKVPVTDAWVVLYSNLADSAIETISPSYITKVDKNGEFLIPFVHENDYHIFAVKDNNYNFLFDIPDEGIAFIDSVFRPGVTKIENTDSLKNKFKNYPDDIELLLFKENKQTQYIKSYKRLKPNYLELVFNSPQSADYKCVVEQDNDAIVFANQNADTIKIWLKNENAINSDLLTLVCNYTDPLYPDTLRTDSLTLRKADILVRDSVANIKINSIKEPHKPLVMTVSNPIAVFDKNKIKLELKSDDVFIPASLNLVKDSLNPMCLYFDSQILEKSEYRIIIEAGFVSDIYNNKNILDTIEISTTSTSEYGNLRIALSGEQRSFIIQLIVGDKVIAETYGENGVAQFEYIKPGKYVVRAIEDLNNNKKWDTGDYAAKKLAEPVFYMSGEYEVRSNWNHDIEWNPVTNVSK